MPNQQTRERVFHVLNPHNQPRVPSASVGWPVPILGVIVRHLALFRTEYVMRCGVVVGVRRQGMEPSMTETCHIINTPDSRAGSVVGHGWGEPTPHAARRRRRRPWGCETGDLSGICLSLAGRRVL